MMKFFSYIFLYLILLSSAYAQINSKDIDRSVVMVVAVRDGKVVSSGSGFVVSKEIVVTNHHVTEEKELVVLTPGVESAIKAYKAIKLSGSIEHDLQFLKVTNLPSPPLPISISTLEKGQEIIAIGYPAVADQEIVSHSALESTLSKGVVGRVLEGSWYKNQRQFSIIQHNASINQGNSGGPLLDSCGRVVGVNTRKAFSEIVVTRGGAITSQTEGIFYASGSQILAELLRDSKISFAEKSNQCDRSLIGAQSGSYSYFEVLGVLLALILGGVATFFSLKRPQVITETYTQFIRRKEYKKSNSLNSSGQKYSLVGVDSLGRAIRINLDSRFAIGSEIIIGRDKNTSRIVLDDSTLSRNHAIIKIVEDGIKIKDLGSTNGTYVDHEMVGANYVFAAIGQKVIFGKVELILNKESK